MNIAKEHIDERRLLLAQSYGILAVQATIVDAQTYEFIRIHSNTGSAGIGVEEIECVSLLRALQHDVSTCCRVFSQISYPTS